MKKIFGILIFVLFIVTNISLAAPVEIVQGIEGTLSVDHSQRIRVPFVVRDEVGSPLEGILVSALAERGKIVESSVYTDEKGVAVFSFEAPAEGSEYEYITAVVVNRPELTVKVTCSVTWGTNTPYFGFFNAKLLGGTLYILPAMSGTETVLSAKVYGFHDGMVVRSTASDEAVTPNFFGEFFLSFSSAGGQTESHEIWVEDTDGNVLSATAEFVVLYIN